MSTLASQLALYHTSIHWNTGMPTPCNSVRRLCRTEPSLPSYTLLDSTCLDSESCFEQAQHTLFCFFVRNRSSWAPQNDILGHPATKAYLTACGIHSIYEAAFHGVPMLGMPFQKEQLYNARRIGWMGIGQLLKNSPVVRKKGAAALKVKPVPFVEGDLVQALTDVSAAAGRRTGVLRV